MIRIRRHDTPNNDIIEVVKDVVATDRPPPYTTVDDGRDQPGTEAETRPDEAWEPDGVRRRGPIPHLYHT